jgi:hypothetical protein
MWKARGTCSRPCCSGALRPHVFDPCPWLQCPGRCLHCVPEGRELVDQPPVRQHRKRAGTRITPCPLGSDVRGREAIYTVAKGRCPFLGRAADRAASSASRLSWAVIDHSLVALLNRALVSMPALRFFRECHLTSCFQNNLMASLDRLLRGALDGLPGRHTRGQSEPIFGSSGELKMRKGMCK